MPTVAFHTLGCKLNFSETSTLAQQFRDAGWQKAGLHEPAEVYIINTCSVTENADKECRTIVKRALQSNPEGKIIIVGCYAQLKPEHIASIPGVNLVLGASEKFNVLQYIDSIDRTEGTQVMACDISSVNQFIPAQSSIDRTRVFLKAQDGCDYSCTFCTIPLARGKSRSDTIANVLLRATEAVEAGAREIILTGVNLGDFGIREAGDRHEDRFIDLVKAIETAPSLEGVRFRISSIEPNLLTNEVVELVASSKRFMPHFHIPMQSGSDDLLKAMRRRYNSTHYRQKIELIRRLIPHAGIGADVITGFPGETDEEFTKTLEFIRDLGLSYLHAFTYSERENTPAAVMDEAVPVFVRRERTRMLRNLSLKLNRSFCELNIGSTQHVLFEADNHDGNMYGYTPNYIRVSVPYNPELINEVVDVRLELLHAEGTVSAMLLNETVTA